MYFCPLNCTSTVAFGSSLNTHPCTVKLVFTVEFATGVSNCIKVSYFFTIIFLDCCARISPVLDFTITFTSCVPSFTFSVFIITLYPGVLFVVFPPNPLTTPKTSFLTSLSGVYVFPSNCTSTVASESSLNTHPCTWKFLLIFTFCIGVSYCNNVSYFLITTFLFCSAIISPVLDFTITFASYDPSFIFDVSIVILNPGVLFVLFPPNPLTALNTSSLCCLSGLYVFPLNCTSTVASESSLNTHPCTVKFVFTFAFCAGVSYWSNVLYFFILNFTSLLAISWPFELLTLIISLCCPSFKFDMSIAPSYPGFGLLAFVPYPWIAWNTSSLA